MLPLERFLISLYRKVLIDLKTLADDEKSQVADVVETTPWLLDPRRWLCHACLSRMSKPPSAEKRCQVFAKVSPLDGVQQLVDALDAPVNIKADAIHVLRAFIGGVASHCCDARMPDQQVLELDFTNALIGETATRSRIPLLLTLEQTLRWHSRVQNGSIIIETPGFGTMSLDGVQECYTGVKALWAERGLFEENLPQRAKVAWEYWLAHKMEFKDTKLFRVIESFACLHSIRLAPAYVLENILMGLLCTNERVIISSMMFKAGKGGKTEVFANVVRMSGDDADNQFKWDCGFQLFAEAVKKPGNLKSALKLCHSQVSFGLFCYGLRAGQHGYEAACGCDPEVLAKIFTPAKPEELGGAVRGYDWQMMDKTWQLTGNTGRMIWHCRGSSSCSGIQ